MELGEALDDVIDSMDEAEEATARPEYGKTEQDYWDVMAGRWSRWWGVFLRQYGNRCFDRWRDAIRGETDPELMDRMWSERHVALQTAGSDIVKQVRLKQVKEAVASLPENAGVSGAESQALTKWASGLDKTLSKLISSHTDMQRQTIARVIRGLTAPEEEAGLGKLRKRILGKG